MLSVYYMPQTCQQFNCLFWGIKQSKAVWGGWEFRHQIHGLPYIYVSADSEIMGQFFLALAGLHYPKAEQCLFFFFTRGEPFEFSLSFPSNFGPFFPVFTFSRHILIPIVLKSSTSSCHLSFDLSGIDDLRVSGLEHSSS